MISENHSNLINTIVNDGRYKSICKRLAGTRRHLADDLYQESMLKILETTDSRLVDAFNGGYLEVYIVGIINKIWDNRNRVKSYDNGQTSPFIEFSSTFNTYVAKKTFEVTEDSPETNPFDYNYIVRRAINKESLDYDPKVDQVFEATKKILKADCNSQVMDVRYMARVYNYSNGNIAELKDMKACSNARQFAASSGINYMAVYKTCCNYKDRLKTKLKHLLND